MSYDEMISVIKAAKNGQRIERTIDGNIWKEFAPIEYGFDFNTFSYSIKPQPTREEITQKWVKDNNIVVGSKVKVVRKVENTVTWALAEKMDNTIGEVGVVKHIFSDRINIYIYVFQIDRKVYVIACMLSCIGYSVPYTTKSNIFTLVFIFVLCNLQ